MEFLFKGMLLGFSTPMGPISVLCVRRTLQFGILSGLCSGLGAVVADTIYAVLVAFGITFVSDLFLAARFWLQLIGGAFLIYLGVMIFRAKWVKITQKTSHTTLLSDFFSTFFLTLTNPLTILFYFGFFSSLGFISDGNYLKAFWLVLGVFVGSSFWWVFLSSATILFRSKVNQKVMTWINRIAGVILMGFGLVAWGSIIWTSFLKGSS